MLLTALLIGMAFAALVVFGAAISESIKELGATQEKLRRAEQDAKIAQKQAEIMAEARTDDETINRLGDGTF